MMQSEICQKLSKMLSVSCKKRNEDSFLISEIADAMSKMSSLSTTSCSPAEIKNRVKKQISLEKKRERARLLKKGETSKYTAVRRELKSQIKDDFW